MNFEEYNEKMKEYSDRLHEEYTVELYKEVSNFQQIYMSKVLEDYKKTIDNEARQHIYNLLCYAVNNSQSGSSIENVDTKELADKIDDILWNEIGDFLLDYEIYQDGDYWAIDCMFGGFYVPYWDGWYED